MKKTIAFITDTHLNETLPVAVNQRQNWERILKDVLERQVGEIVIGGDIGHPSSYAGFFSALGGCGIPFRVIPGNHDALPDLLQQFPNPEYPDNAELYYSSRDENFLYLFLDSSTDAISDQQLRWLREKVDDNSLKILLFVHHPVFEVDTPVDRKYPLQNREAVLQIFAGQAHEVFIFCGHYHAEDETGSGAISQYETPAVSYQIRKGTPDVEPHAEYFGYRLITVENANLSSELITFTP